MATTTTILRAVALAWGVSSVALADPIVSNGNFATSSGGTGGYGQLAGTFNGTSTPNSTGVIVSGWSNANFNNSTAGYNYLFNASNALTGVGGVKLYSVAALPTGGGFSNFIGADGAYEQGALTTTVTGLFVGEQVAISFWQAGAQQVGYGGITTDNWSVTLGGTTGVGTPATMTVPSNGSTPWTQQTVVFTATGTSEVLSFLANGSPNGEPPFLLLGGVTAAAVPEPSALILMGMGMVGIGVVRIRRRARTISA